MLTLGLAVAMLAAACAAYAYPTLAGPTGLVNVPTAEVASAGQFVAALDYYNSKDNGKTDSNSYPFRVLYGFGNNLEVGVGYDSDALSMTSYPDETETLSTSTKALWDVNAKYKIPSYFGADWAVGALYGQANTDPDNTNVTQVYLAGTKDFSTGEGAPSIKGTIGVNWTQVKATVTNSAWRFFLGAEAIVMPNLSVLADVQTKDSDLDRNAMWSAAARYAFTPVLSAQLGFTNGPIIGANDTNLLLGVDYTFGGEATE